MESRVLAILGCTASGKGALARALAERIGGEVLSVDSMKVYRGMDIGSAKPSPEARRRVRHHLVDVVDPTESFSAARFVALADAAVDDAHARGRPVVAVGGTVLYFKCLYEGMFAGPSADPELRAELRRRASREGPSSLHEELARVDPASAARIHRNDLRRIERALEVHRLTGVPISTLQRQWDRGELRRPDWTWRLIGVDRDSEQARARINERVRRMVAAGLVEEARRLWDAHDAGRGLSPQARQAIGYAELYEHFGGGAALDEAIEAIKIHTRRLAKHQRTWLRRLAGVSWIDGPREADAAEAARALAATCDSG